MNIIKAILLGAVEGIAEWLPISSTAHIKIFSELLSFDVSSDFYGVFEVVIQLGASAALLFIFWNKIWPFGESKNPLGKGILSYVKKDKFILCLKLALSCIPVILYRLFVYDYVNFVNESNEMLIIALSLIIVGIAFIAVEFLIKDKKFTITSTKQITFLDAFIIGVTQLVAAIFPGVSRSGATIIASLLMGVSRITANEFTYELAIPVMLGASLMEVLDFGLSYSFVEILIILFSCVSSFIVSLFVIRFAMNYIKKNTFTIFGIYRIILGIIIIIFLI